MKQGIHEKKLIRNSTVEFLIFTAKAGEASIEVRYKDETIWLTQKMMATLLMSMSEQSMNTCRTSLAAVNYSRNQLSGNSGILPRMVSSTLPIFTIWMP